MRYLITNISGSDPDLAGFDWYVISLDAIKEVRQVATQFAEWAEKFTGNVLPSGLDCVGETGYFLCTDEVENYLDTKLNNYQAWLSDDESITELLHNSDAVRAGVIKIYPESFQATLVPENTEVVLYSENIAFADLTFL